MDVTFVLSALICTLLAIVVATSLLKGSAGDCANSRNYFGHKGGSPTGGLGESGPTQNGHFSDSNKKKKPADGWSDPSGSSHDHWDVVKSVLSGSATKQTRATELTSIPAVTNEGATEDPGSKDKVESKTNSFMKYIPGKSQSHHLQAMMSAEELKEEQRVQREQLAAIFQLLKDNQETFGEVTEGDMKEQLKLYSI